MIPLRLLHLGIPLRYIKQHNTMYKRKQNGVQNEKS